MRRRTLLSSLGVVLALPVTFVAGAAEKVYRIGILEPTPETQNGPNFNALRKGMRRFGYEEGRNVVFLYRSAEGRAERFPQLASALAKEKVDLIVTRGTPAVQAAEQAAGGTIPIVMAAMGAPLLVVASLAHPGGNITGMTTFSEELIGKRLELLRELIPTLSRVGLIHNFGNPMGPPEGDEAKAAAKVLGIEVAVLDARTEHDLRGAFEEATRQHLEALIVGADGLIETHKKAIISLAETHRLPAIHPSRDFVEIGGLMAYAVNYPDLYFRAASHIDKILKGARPGDIPVEQPTRLELVINLRTAKALGLTVPQALLARADEVIE